MRIAICFLTAALVGGAAVRADEPIAPTDVIKLFDGRDLSQFYTWLQDTKHDDPRGVAPQRHAPESVADRTYYRPTGFGAEAQYAARLERIRAILAGD